MLPVVLCAAEQLLLVLVTVSTRVSSAHRPWTVMTYDFSF